MTIPPSTTSSLSIFTRPPERFLDFVFFFLGFGWGWEWSLVSCASFGSTSGGGDDCSMGISWAVWIGSMSTGKTGESDSLFNLEVKGRREKMAIVKTVNVSTTLWYNLYTILLFNTVIITMIICDCDNHHHHQCHHHVFP